jgi:hypothetical protein
VEDGNQFACLVLRLDFEDVFTAGLMDVISEGVQNQKWVVSDPDVGQNDEYTRAHDATDFYVADVAVVEDEDGSGNIDRNEVTHRTVKYADFWRTVATEGGVEETESYFVEVDEDAGRITMWKGNETGPSNIEVL